MNNTGHIKHSVIVITYKQEDLIGRALDSLISQKEYIYEIIIADDCSPDNNWSVIQNYKTKYPDLIKAYRNDVNLGIFGNIENTWDKVSGDLVWYLSGDDIYCQGVFIEANKLINNEKIDYINNAVTLYFDYKSIDTKGNEKIYRNNLVENYNPVSLKIRNIICNRTSCISRKVFDKFYPVPKDIGILADGLLDLQTQIFSDFSYYSPFVGSAYYTNIGISSITKFDDITNSYIISLELMKSTIPKILSIDKIWLCYLQDQLKFRAKSSISNYIKCFRYSNNLISCYFGISFLKREVNKLLYENTKLMLKYYLKKLL